MENVSRGLPSITELDIDNNLQYVESEDLERTWKSSRRQRLKHQEDKIWEEFCGEKDIVTNACSDDPYQFLEQIPEWKLKQLMELELEMLRKEEAQEEVGKGDAGDADTQLALTYNIQPEQDNSKCDQNHNIVETTEMVQPSPHQQTRDSDPEDNKSEGLNTVRQLSPTAEVQQPPPAPPAPSTPRTGAQRGAGRNSGTNNIYCDKILELRNKIIENIKEFVEAMEIQNIFDMLPESLTKLNRHSSEFCARFNRNYIYPITRQMADIKRHQSRAFPLAQHTHHQAQLLRVHAAHQHILQAFMIFSKNFAQTIMVEETITQLMNYITTLRECDQVFANLTAPGDLKAANDLYNDEMLSSFNNLELCLMEYKERIDTVMFHFNETKPKSATKIIRKSYDTKPKNPLRRNPTRAHKPDTDAKLSMYSLNQTVSSIHLRSTRTCTSNRVKRSYLKKPQEKNIINKNHKPESNGVPKKIPSGHRAITRPGLRTSTARSAAARSDPDITTLVESIDCMSKKSKDSTPKSKTRKKSATLPKVPKNTKSKNVEEKTEKEKCILDLKAEGDKMLSCDTTQVTRDDDGRLNHSDFKSPTQYANKVQDPERRGHDVTELLRNVESQPLPSNRNIVQGAKNVQLICIDSSSPRHTTPQLLKILAKTIEKQSPKPLASANTLPKDHQLLQLNVSGAVEARLLDYRLRFLERILANPLYANTKYCKPWELVNRASEGIVQELVGACARDLQLGALVSDVYRTETAGL